MLSELFLSLDNQVEASTIFTPILEHVDQPFSVDDRKERLGTEMHVVCNTDTRKYTNPFPPAWLASFVVPSVSLPFDPLVPPGCPFVQRKTC